MLRRYEISNGIDNNDAGYSVKTEKINDMYNIYILNPDNKKIYESKKTLNEKNLCLTLFNWSLSISLLVNIINKYYNKDFRFII